MRNRGLAGISSAILLIIIFIAIGALIKLGGISLTGYDIYPLGSPACGSTISDNVTFDADLDCSGVGGNGLEIGADNITLDCNGFTITGDGSSGYGINVSGYSGIKIQNCTITSFGNGIFFAFSSHNNLTNNTINDNAAYGIWMQNSTSNIINGNTINNNGQDGIFFYYLSNNNNLTNNTFNGNTVHGVNANVAVNSILVNNTANGNQHGIQIGGGQSNTLINNTADSNTDSGIWVSASLYVTMTGNNMSNNHYNFYIEFTSTEQIIHNIDTTNLVDGRPIYYYRNIDPVGTVPDDAGMVIAVNSSDMIAQDLVLYNNSHGIILASTNDSLIINNTINDAYGIYLRSSTHNNLTNNAANGGLTGIIVYYFSTNNTLTNNTANNNIENGIDVNYYSNFTNLTGNTANDNVDGRGISINGGSDNILVNNTANNHVGYGRGIEIYGSRNDFIVNNTAENNYEGIILTYTFNDTLYGNAMSGNTYNFDIPNFVNPYYVEHNIDTTNLVDGKPIRYYRSNPSVGTVPDGTGMVIAVHSNGVNASGLTLNNNGYGVLLVDTNDSIIQDNNMNFNINGIWIQDNTNITISNNTLKSNAYGIYAKSSTYNNLIDNIVNNNLYGLLMYFVNYTNIINITANNNSYDAVAGDGAYGIFMDRSFNNTIVNSTANNNNFGIYIQTSRNNTLINNTANDNYYDSDMGDGGYGSYFISGSSNNSLENNTFCSNEVNDVYFYSDSTNNTGSNDCLTIDDQDTNTGFSCSGNCPAPPVTDCMNITSAGNWTLTTNLTGNQSWGGCIGINADDVTLDCDGWNMTGNYSPVKGFGIYVDGVNNTKISNCYVTNYEFGYSVQSSTFTNMTNNTVHGNHVGIYLLSSSNSTILDNNADNNEDDGIRVSDSSINNTITNNTANNNSVFGIIIESSSDNNTLTNNTANNGEYGISIWFDSDNNTLTNNTANNNYYNVDDGDGGFGIFFESSADNILTNNTAFNNTYGIYLTDAFNNTLTNNTANDNYYNSDLAAGGYGITLVSSSNNNTLTNNIAKNNTEVGIYLDDSHNNTLTNNTANDNDDGTGFYLNGCMHNTLTNNTANNNSQIGIWLSASPYTTLINNTANSNRNQANIFIDADSNNTILTNNTANDNVFMGIAIYSSNSILINNTVNNNYDGIDSYSCSNNTLTNNTINNNEQYGIFLDVTDNMTLINNTLNNNSFGIYLRSSLNNTFSNNNVSDNYYNSDLGDGGYGFYVETSNNTILTNNTAFNNLYGVYLIASSSNNTLTNNTASNNQYGIYFESSSNNTITNNTANDNSIRGVSLRVNSFSNTLINSTLRNNYYGIHIELSNSNNITGSQIENSTMFGIYMRGPAVNNTISSNNITGSGNSGFYLIGGSNIGRYVSDNILSGNNITDSTNWGIEMRYSGWSGTPSNTLVDNSIRNASSGCIGVCTFGTACQDTTINGGEITDCGVGISLNSDMNNITNVYIWNTTDGIDISGSNNTIKYNNLTNNTAYAISMSGSDNNTVTDDRICYNVAALYNDTDTSTIDNNTFCVDVLSGPANGSSVTTFPSSISVNISNPIFDTECNLSMDGVRHASVPVTAPDVLNNNLTTFTLGAVSLRQGAHNYIIYCNDSGGSNTGNAVVQFTVPGAAPPTPPSPGGGDFPPVKPTPVPPVTPTPPTEAPETWPGQIPIPTPGSVITIPPSGISILLMGNMTDHTPEEGSVAIILYPGTTGQAVINNISAFIPENLHCNQKPLSSYEINITAEIINYCMKYKGTKVTVNESTISVWKLTEGEWQELPPGQVIRDTDIICGNITSANTPYMIAGFTPVVGITEEVAMASIRDAEAAINQASGEGKVVNEAARLLEQAKAAYVNCDYGSANDLASRAATLALGIPVVPLATLFILLIVVIIVGISYWYIKQRVKPKALRRRK